MATEVILPVLGETMDEGTIVNWYAGVGQLVEKGQPLYQLETDKAVLEVEAPASGVVREVYYGPGSKIPVLTVVGLIAGADEDVGSCQGVQPELHARVSEPAQTAVSQEAAGQNRRRGRVVASPRARKLARQKRVDLSQVRGTGPDGRVVERDVEAHLQMQPAATPTALRLAAQHGLVLAGVEGTGPGGRVTSADVEAELTSATSPSGAEQVPVAPWPQTTPFGGVRRLTAERMSASAHSTAPVTLTTEADATDLANLREVLKQNLEPSMGFAVSYTDILVAVVARALGEHPYMNSKLVGDQIQQPSSIHVGVAVDTPRGLLVPVIKDADRKGVGDIARALRELAGRAREGKSLPDDLSGGTFTITNLGMYEIDAFTPIINLPESAILGVGRLRDMPVAHQGEIRIRKMVVLSLTFDHRLNDGAPAARFLQRVKQLIEQPYLLLG